MTKPSTTRTCRECGCTGDLACPGGCWWIGADLCSACRERDEPTEGKTVACLACRGEGLIGLPTIDGILDYSCPCCVPWSRGFPGEYMTFAGARWYIIEPSGPDELARWNGWPTAGAARRLATVQDRF